MKCKQCFSGCSLTTVLLIFIIAFADCATSLNVRFTFRTYIVVEGDVFRPELILSESSSTDITVQVIADDITTTGGGVDYNSGPYSVIFPAGVTRASFSITINIDDVLEDHETFHLIIVGDSLPEKIALGGIYLTKVTIINIGGSKVSISFNKSAYIVNEDEGLLQAVALFLSKSKSTDITVQVGTNDSTATGGGVDYNSGPYNVIIPARVKSVSFNITINNDNELENNEIFYIAILEGTLPENIILGEIYLAKVTIDSGMSISFKQSTYSVSENEGLVEIVLVVNLIRTDITVQVRSSDNTATGGVDYSSGPYNVTFPARVPSASFNITINDDNLLEYNETFSLFITLPDNITLEGINITEVTIVNNGAPAVSVSLNQSVYIINENGGLVQANLFLNTSLATDITVQVRANDGTATGGGVDYNSGLYNVIFAAGVTSVSFNVAVNTDDILEGNETFILAITNLSPSEEGFAVTTGDHGKATVTIIDISKPVAHPISIVRYLNTTATLSCNATTSSDIIRYQWRRVNGDITSDRANGVNTSTLTISSLTEQDEDEYYCVAIHGGTVNGILYNVTSNKANIIVYGPPTVKPITIGIQEVLPISSVYYLIDGDHIQLNCLATNDPQSPDELNFIWYKDSTIVDSQGLRRVTGKSSNGQSFILFYNLDMSQDNGTYTCSVKNFELGRAITQSAVVIIEIPTFIITHPQSVNISIYQNLTISCEATGSNPIRYQWRRVNGEITSDRAKGMNTSTLTISSVTEQDEDEYYCISSNGGPDGLLYSDTSNKAIITVYVPIVMTTHPQPVVVYIGQRVTLSCKAIANDIIRYQWRRVNGEITSDRANGVNTSTLTISSVTEQDEDKYYCMANYGPVNGILYNVTSNKANVIVYGPPTVQPIHAEAQPASPVYYVIAGNQLTLYCHATNDPQSPSKLQFIWYRDSIVVNRQSAIIVEGSYSILEFNNLDVSQDNGTYTCSVANFELGEAVNQSTIVIVEIPVVITTHPRSTIISLAGQSVTLSCEATGSNPIRYQWRRVNGEITSDRANGVNTSTLIISSLKEQDEDEYYCIASNGGPDGLLYSDTSNRTILIAFGFQWASATSSTLRISSGSRSSTTSTSKPFSLRDSSTLSISSPASISSVITSNLVASRYTGFSTASNFISTSTSLSKSDTLATSSIPSTSSTSHTLKASSTPRISTSSTSRISTSSSGFRILTTSSIPSISTSTSSSIPHISSTSSAPRVSTSSNHTASNTPSVSTTHTSMSSSILRISLSSSTLRISTSLSTFSTLTTSSTPSTSTTPRISTSLSISAPLSTPRISTSLSTTVSTSSSGFSTLTTSSTTSISSILHTSMTSSATTLTSSSATTSTSLPSRTLSQVSSTLSVSTTLNSPSTSGDSTLKDGSNSNTGVIGAIGGIVIVLIIIIVIINVMIIILLGYRKKHRKQKSLLPSSATNPLYESSSKADQELVELKSLPLISITEEEVKTSVGQPTTLHITVGGDPEPEISWTKDGEPIDHLILSDGSLYISDTTDNDQGSYLVTANNSEGKSSKMIQLVVLNPQFAQSNVNMKPIEVEDFAEHLAVLQSNMCEQLQTEYESIPLDTTAYTFHAAKLAVNVNKNRYKNVIPYDHSRVVLELEDNCLGSDYINASFIDGYNRKNAYIACQGPNESTVADFWRMVWEQCVNTIVMVTKLNEGEKPKCHQYWPNNANDSIEYGNVSVTLLKENVQSHFTIRKLVIKMTKPSSQTKVADLEVNQFHFTDWPDHGVPSCTEEMLSFHECLHKQTLGTPLLVHCSAGVGQTGAFIAIDIELQRIKQEGVVDVYNTVCKMRHKRMSTVQTQAQYMFVLNILMESIKRDARCITGPVYIAKEKLEKLANTDVTTNLSGYESQFKNLNEVSPQVADFQYGSACMVENRLKNRSMKHLPPDSSRVCIAASDEVQSDYICANYIDGYHHPKAFLVTEGPMYSTMVEFWTMVWEKKSHAIVMLSLLEENGEEVSAKYWPDKGDTMEVGVFTIENDDEKSWGNYFVRRIINITSNKESSPRTIYQFQYLSWPDHSCPSGLASIIDLVELVKEIQDQNNNGPITVHCSDGVGRTGTFCALMLCYQRLLTEHMADVFDTINTIRAQRPGMVENLEQYEFIHKAILEMMDRLVAYSN